MPPLAQRRRWSLRARLTALVLAVAALALLAVDIVLPLNLKASLISSRDATLTGVINSVPKNRTFNLQTLISVSDANPLRGEIGWSIVSDEGVVKSAPPPGNAGASPDIPEIPPVTEAETVGDTSGGRATYRILALKVTQGQQQEPGYLVAWVSLADVNNTVSRLILTELLITAGLLVLLGATASLVIRRELKPLETMATAAEEITRGDLDRRVDMGDPGTEVGRLGFAFNGMLDGISDLLDERRRNEERLRQFLADASHELRTPVAAVRGYTDLYRAGALPDDGAVDRAMQRMGFESRRMGALVEDLLTLVQADAERNSRHERVDLTDLLTGVVDDAAVIDPERTWRLLAGPGGEAASVLGDRLRLHQLFANLLSNIRTHTPAGTVATVSFLPGTDDLAVTISDNGPGVTDEDLPRLFDRFYRVDPSRSRERGGTGLGLSIVAAIVRSHSGRIMASHTPGGGLTVTVVLPRAVGTAAVPALVLPAEDPVTESV